MSSAYQAGHINWSWTFGVLAVIFNPVIPLHMGRQLWIVIDVLALIVVLISFWRFDAEPR